MGWLNQQESGTQGLVLLALTAIGWVVAVTVPWLWRTAFGSVSRYEQWTKLAEQFHDIAKRDNDVVLPTDKKKVLTADYGDLIRFEGGSQPHHAAETEALSRVAGKLLVKSTVRPRRHRFGYDQRRRWVEFVTESIRIINHAFAKENIRDLSNEKMIYIHVNVFPLAAHLTCLYCASVEKRPKP